MTTLIIGTNKIHDCENAVSIAGVPLFAVDIRDGTPVLTFHLSSPPATSEIRIKDNRVLSGDVSVTPDGTAVVVRLGDTSLCRVCVTNPNEVRVDLDLRPLGLNIYTDKVAFHVGGATLSQNIIRRCQTAINVG